MKKIILFLIMFIFGFLMQSTFAEEVYKITSVTFDTSSSVLILTSPDGTASPIASKIKTVKLQNPNRVYFDINSAVLTCPKEDVNFSTGIVKHAVVAQNSSNPPIVRVVLTLDENYNADKLNIYRIKNNIVVKYGDSILQKESYFQNTFREERSSDADYYEYSAITTQVISKNEKPLVNAQNVSIPNGALKDIQSAFSSANIPKEIETAFSDVEVKQVKRDLKLNTRYYLNNISKTPNGILLSGFGSLAVEKPMLLSEPARIVYDMPNTFVNKNLRNKEFIINETETVKIGQFEANKARVVLKTSNPDKYVPIYSPDNETLLIADVKKLDISTLSSVKANMVATFYTGGNPENDLILAFSAPVVYSVQRFENQFVLTAYNIDKYNEASFINTLKGTELCDMKLRTEGKLLKVMYELAPKGRVKVYAGVDGKSLKISVNEPEVDKKQRNIPFFKKKITDKVVVIDPGHGGIDYGAIRAGVNEKSINLDVSQRLAAILKEKGYKVYLTRNDDSTLSLQDRVDIAEDKDEDIFISVHVNASEKTDIIGVETHYYHDYSKELARIIHESLAKHIKTTDRGLFKSKFYVINHTTKPAILVEIGFLSNENERQQLLTDERKQNTAKAIAEGVINYFKEYK